MHFDITFFFLAVLTAPTNNVNITTRTNILPMSISNASFIFFNFYANPTSIPTVCTKNATHQAIKHWIIIVAIAAFVPPISRFTVAIAATQGVYKRVNIRNTVAVNGVNKPLTSSAFSPSKTVNVETTLFFAVKPVSNAVETLQSPNPNGTKIGDTKPPKIASKLYSADSATFNLESNVCKNQITIDARKIIVNAF